MGWGSVVGKPSPLICVVSCQHLSMTKGRDQGLHFDCITGRVVEIMNAKTPLSVPSPRVLFSVVLTPVDLTSLFSPLYVGFDPWASLTLRFYISW